MSAFLECVSVHIHMYVCVPNVCLVSVEIRTGYQILDLELQIVVSWDEGLRLGSLQNQVLLNTEPSLQHWLLCI